MKMSSIKNLDSFSFSDQLITLYAPTGISASLLSYGAALFSLKVPDRHGNLVDVVLGHRELSGYQTNSEYLGVTVGRNANRIQGARFEINGVAYQLPKNNGDNNLHSNPNGFNKRPWEAEILPRENCKSIRFNLTSENGDGGFPGNLKASVTYSLFNNTLEILYSATTDADTLFNPTNHSYFNLNGEASGYALDQNLWINADAVTPFDSELIPTGEIKPINDSPLDFRTEKLIESDMQTPDESMRVAKGYDHNYVLKQAGKLRPVATLRSDLTGIKMTVITDRPGMHFYSGGSLEGKTIGKSGKTYQPYAGVCFETQTFPDAIHHPRFPSSVLKAGTTFESRTAFQFSTFLF